MQICSCPAVRTGHFYCRIPRCLWSYHGAKEQCAFVPPVYVRRLAQRDGIYASAYLESVAGPPEFLQEPVLVACIGGFGRAFLDGIAGDGRKLVGYGKGN